MISPGVFGRQEGRLVSARCEVQFDHHSAEFAQAPHEVLARVREKCPVAWTQAHGGYWVITGYDEIGDALRDNETFSSHHDPEGPKQGVLLPPLPTQAGILEMDPPEHHSVRKHLAPYFSPSAVDAMREELLQLTTECIDDFIETGEAELIEQLASPVPAKLTVRLLGLPDSEWSVLADVFHKGAYLPSTEENMAEIHGMLLRVHGQLHELVMDRRANPRDDVITSVANLRLDGELLPVEKAAGVLLNLAAGGIDTTTSLIAHTFVHLDRFPEHREFLLEDPSRLRVACEEFLRVYPPVLGFARTVTAGCEFAGQELAKDDRVWVSFGAGNRDEKVFEDPDDIRLDRLPNRHASFGLGRHRCLGSNLARVIWHVVVGEVLRRLPDYRVDHGVAQRYPDCGDINGWVSVPVTFTPGPRAGGSR
ncbi:cytochrome P450 [Mycolicibacterium phlei]|uniref:cytochrome P450 n=1 Tax=Mycolicibacterium phlei TaxID=1771 RepID=UPI0037C6ED53